MHIVRPRLSFLTLEEEDGMRSCVYQIVGTQEREQTLFFMLDTLLRSRIDTGQETSDDEDVNVYLAHLLHSFMDHSFLTQNQGLLSVYDSEVFARTEEKDDLRSHYKVYKGNADYALMTTSVFSECERRHSSTRQNCDQDAQIERGKFYYQIASSYRARLSRKKTAVVTILTKLSDRFETYMKILTHARTAYFHLLKRISEGEIYHLQREAQQRAIPEITRLGKDCFLDAYSNWLESDSDGDRRKVNALGFELAKVDSKFQFQGI